jgi:hypothetical protein
MKADRVRGHRSGLVSSLRAVTPTSHDELRRILAAHGQPVELIDHAAWGLALLAGGSGRSKLGGLPEIVGDWPTNNGRGLTHLASIVLEELPDIPLREGLPRTGTVVFFADFSWDNEGWGPVDATDPVIEIVHVLPGDQAVTATPPADDRDEDEVPVVLNERRVRIEPVLTLPTSEEVFDALNHEDDVVAQDTFFVALDRPDHLLLGEPGYIQEDPRGPGELSLLQINWDTELGFEFGDGGQISFYGRADDLREGRWDRVRAMPDSS